ncbi:MAG: hypothetical protein GY751_21170 [Bacteroidetes bacterium]|nr:hypothetical protein [Bacteroidota bacterium]
MANHKKHVKTQMDSIFAEIEDAGVQKERMSKDDLSRVFEIANTKDYIVWVSDHTKFEPLFVNDAGRTFYGFPSVIDNRNGIELFSILSHPDYADGLHKFIAFFRDDPKGTFRMTNCVKSASGAYKWVYTEERAWSFDKFGNAKHIISIVYDIEEWLDGNNSRTKTKQFRDEQKLYQSLTPREREILDLVAAEMTSQEIGSRLNIEASTVDTHRKNILKKLKLKSSLGLVKYSLNYSNGGFHV